MSGIRLDPAGAPVVSPTREDPVAAALSEVAGGAAGSRIRGGGQGWWTATRILIVLSIVVLSLGVIQKEHCRAQGWSTPDQFFHACYSDLPAMYVGSGLADGVQPYLQPAGGTHLEQPVLTGLVMWGVAQVVPDGSRPGRVLNYYDLSTFVIGALVVALVMLTIAGAGRRRPWDAALVALSPLIALSSLVSLDLFGVVLATAGLVAWGRRRPVLAGALLGLAVTARVYPVMILVVIGLLAVRGGRIRQWLVSVLAALVTASAVVVPWAVANPAGLLPMVRSWWRSTAGYGSPWLLTQTMFGDSRPRWASALGLGATSLSPGAVTALAVLGLVLAVVVGIVLALGADRRPRVAQLAFVVLAVVVITGKAWPVQESLWLLPLAALARPRWRDHLIWMGAEAMYFVAVWLYIAAATNPTRALPGSWYSAFLVLRVLGLLWLVAMVVRDVWHPDRDPVRASGQDDPLAGALPPTLARGAHAADVPAGDGGAAVPAGLAVASEPS
jgi:uncharacterized membrane protein